MAGGKKTERKRRRKYKIALLNFLTAIITLITAICGIIDRLIEKD